MYSAALPTFNYERDTFVGGVVSQQAAAHQLLLFPYAEQAQLRLFQFFFTHAIKAVPELL